MEYSLIYISEATDLMSHVDLQIILDQSFKKNRERSITGMLLYVEGVYASADGRKIKSKKGGRFMQVLEGSKDDVLDIFRSIKMDNRHQNIVVIREAETKFRDFETWLMGFRSFSWEEYSLMPGYFNLDQTFIKLADRQSKNSSLNFLKSFYQRGQQGNALFG